MSRLRVHSFAISLDGYGAVPKQDLDNPLGVGGVALHEWVFGTRTFRQMFGQDGGATGIDDDFVARGLDNIGAWIIGRNMFGPVRGPWPDNVWKGWWGENPPYHTPVLVLTNHPRASIDMSGARPFTLSPTAFTPHLNERLTLRTVRMSGLAAGSLQSVNTFAPDLSMRCT